MSILRCVSSERGAVLIYTLVILLTLLGFAALAVDLGVLYTAAQQVQNVADAAALAGAERLRSGMNIQAATQDAIETAASNKVLGQSATLTAADVRVGAWDKTNKTVKDWDPTATDVAVQVTIRRTQDSSDGPVPTFFAKMFGVTYTQVTRSAVAGLSLISRPRKSLNLMIVQDGSTSLQRIWPTVTNADIELLKNINKVSVDGDSAGIVAFNSAMSEKALANPAIPASARSLYRSCPWMNQGIKYATDLWGVPQKTTEEGVVSTSGQYRPMIGPLTSFDPNNHSTLVTALDKASKLVTNGKAWGDTDTSVGLTYAIDQLLASGSPDADKVIVLVSDGRPHDSDGDAETLLKEQAAIAAADRAGSEGIKIYTVTLEGSSGTNFAFNEGLIRNGGYALRAADATKLSELLNLVARTTTGAPSLVK